MEVRSRPGMGRDGSCYISRQMKHQTAAAGFRVGSGWAIIILLTASTDLPLSCDTHEGSWRVKQKLAAAGAQLHFGEESQLSFQ